MGPALLTVLLPLLLGVSGSSAGNNSEKENYLQTVCGRPIYTSRIVGGQDAVLGHWPWMVSLRISYEHVCGGSLINERWILTAAHCLTATWTFLTYTVWLGSIDSDYSNGGLERYVSKIVIHPNYKERAADIALLKLYSRVTFTSHIRPICLPSIRKHVAIPASCWVTGWGKTDTNTGPKVSPTLKEVEVPVIDHKACEQLYNPYGVFFPTLEPIIKEDMICAGGYNRMKDSCKGDSGGPLVCYIDNVWIQVGVVSWGSECGKFLPGVYANVIYYQKWISDTISRAEVLGSKKLVFSKFLLPTGLLSLSLLGPSCGL